MINLTHKSTGQCKSCENFFLLEKEKTLRKKKKVNTINKYSGNEG